MFYIANALYLYHVLVAIVFMGVAIEKGDCELGILAMIILGVSPAFGFMI